MSWVAVDKNMDEYVYTNRPYREGTVWELDDIEERGVLLPAGSIEKLLGYKLTWNDETVEL